MGWSGPQQSVEILWKSIDVVQSVGVPDVQDTAARWTA